VVQHQNVKRVQPIKRPSAEFSFVVGDQRIPRLAHWGRIQLEFFRENPPNSVVPPMPKGIEWHGRERVEKVGPISIGVLARWLPFLFLSRLASAGAYPPPGLVGMSRVLPMFLRAIAFTLQRGNAAIMAEGSHMLGLVNSGLGRWLSVCFNTRSPCISVV